MTRSSDTSSSPNNRSSASAWGIVRGKPSRMKPRLASGWASRSAMSPTITSSGTSAPRSMKALASRPRGVPLVTASRSMSPVATCGTLHSRASSRAWVPLPAPGGPRKTRRTPGSAPRERARARARPLEETLVVAHQQVRLHLAHGVERDADHDQEAGAAEVERHVEPSDQEVGQHRDEGQEERAGQRDAGED